MSHHPFVLKNVKQRLSRKLNALQNLVQEGQEFEEPWNFPTQKQELDLFLTQKKMMVKNLMLRLEQRREDISEHYAACNQTINEIIQENITDVESQFDEYWSEKRGEELIIQSQELERNLEKRLIELECQEQSMKQELAGQSTINVTQNQSQVINQMTSTTSSGTLERRFLGNELKIPNFYGDPTQYASFWELFEELVHKQPYSNIEKLSILVNCCKGDAARTLQMIPRTGESYEKAIQQLKNQFEDPRRVTMESIRKLKSMKRCRDDHRSLRNNLGDIQAILATLEKQGETIDTTNMRSMILNTFSKDIHDEMIRKEFDSGNIWSMTDLIENLTTAVRRKEHVDSVKENYQEKYSIFHTNVNILNRVRCTGCGHQHKFQYCSQYSTVKQKIESLRELNACWKCFSRRHTTEFCRKQNCAHCRGLHNISICRRRLQMNTNRANFRYHRDNNSVRGSPEVRLQPGLSTAADSQRVVHI